MKRALRIAAAALVLGGCASARPAPRATLPTDSLELLQAALARVRPGFDSQTEALSAGVYANAGSGSLAAAPGRTSPNPTQISPSGGEGEDRSSSIPPTDRTRPTATTGSARAAEITERTEPPAPPSSDPPPARVPAVEADQRADPPGGDTASAPRGVRYVVQVAAFRGEAEALAASETAARAFPGLSVEVERSDGWYRVLLRGWPDRASAASRLDDIRERFPDAWVRSSPVP